MKYWLQSFIAAALLFSLPAYAQSGMPIAASGKTSSPSVVGMDNTTANKAGFDNGGQKQDTVVSGTAATGERFATSPSAIAAMDPHQADIAATDAARDTANQDEFSEYTPRGDFWPVN
jgi:hypothetical protein